METIENKIVENVSINDICFGDVTMLCKQHCLHIYNSKGWVGVIALEDIKTFTSNNSEVNKFILEQISK